VSRHSAPDEAPQAAASKELLKERTPRVNGAELLRRTFDFVVFPQTTKPTGEGDSVLDGDVLARHHDALDEQAYQPLPALEVERVEPLTHGRGKGLQLRFPLAQPLLIGMLRLESLARARAASRAASSCARRTFNSSTRRAPCW